MLIWRTYPAIARLFLEVADEVVDREPSFRHVPDARFVERRYEDRVQGAERGVLVAVLDRTCVGFADAVLMRNSDAGTYHAPGLDVYVDELIVASEARRRGIVTSLMRAVEAWARGAGARIVTLDTHVSNEAARGLYAALGYREFGVVIARDL
jgi:ribosomal protein S18 acetylase RimI-like enzyme